MRNSILWLNAFALTACSGLAPSGSYRQPAPKAGTAPESSETPQGRIDDGTKLPPETTEEEGGTDVVDAIDPDTEADADPKDELRSSGGKGGPSGFSENRFRATNGLTSSYKINVPADAGVDKAYGLHIHLHGDGGGGYVDFPNRETKNGLIGVTIKAPNRNLQWGRSEGRAHGEYVQDLIQNELLKKYNVDLDRIYFSGVSGGSFFLAGNFIPSYGKDYKSGAFLMCGGEAPRVAFVGPEFLKSFRITWQETAGERDDIVRSVRQSIDAYKKALSDVAGDDDETVGLQVSEFKGNGGHCEFDGRGYTSGIQFMMDQKFSTILAK